MPRSGIVGSYGSSNLVFWRTSILISIVAALIYIPTNIFSPALSSLQYFLPCIVISPRLSIYMDLQSRHVYLTMCPSLSVISPSPPFVFTWI
jgi:hypothetical protein